MSYAHDEDLNELPPYPVQWEAHQRVAAYWHALNFTSFPGTTQGWYAVWKSLEREHNRRHPSTEETA